jgi:hypothetical protein
MCKNNGRSPALMCVMAAIAIGLLLFIEIAASQPAAAPPSAAGSDGLQGQPDLLKAHADRQRELVEKLRLENDQLRAMVEGAEAPLRAKFLEAQQRLYQFEAELMNATEHSFLHQRIASYVILTLVVCIVLAGLWFAHIQLMAGIAPIRPDFAAPVIAGADGSLRSGNSVTMNEAALAPAVVVREAPRPGLGVTTIDASLQKVTVTSSVVGIVVLLISLAFLYVYTVKVFEIVVVDPYRPKLTAPVPVPSDVPPPTNTQ